MFNLCYPALSKSSQCSRFKLVSPQQVDRRVSLLEVNIYIHSPDTSVTVFLGKRSSSPLMRRIQECLETGSHSHLAAFFLVPLVSLSYAVHQWRTLLAIMFSHTPDSKYKFFGEADIETEVRLR